MKVVVIGGGPAGMISAYFGAKLGNEVILVEKNEKLGKKLYITGKGRCNVTNDCDVDEFLSNVVSNPRFLNGAARRFPPEKFMGFLEEKQQLKVERGNRVYPSSDKASDITKALENHLKDVGVDVRLNEEVKEICAENGNVNAVITSKESIDCDRVIVCTGGISYPSTGSTGDGYKFSESFGHKVVQPVAALCGIELKGSFFKPLQGVSLKNVELTAYQGDKKLFSQFGEMLFTHFGISGPIVLTTSSYINRLDLKTVKLSLDLKPALSEEQLDARILRDFEKYKNKLVRNSLDDLLLKSLIPVVIEASGIDGDKKNSEFSKADRKKLVTTIKNLTMYPSSLRSVEEGIITSGGVDVGEINPKTMESKLVNGLYFAGEVLDVDALTGGFNITVAACTAYCAGNAQIIK